MLEDKNNKQHDISEYGEFGLIDLLTKNIEVKNNSTLKGIGDDAAVIDNKDRLTLVSHDLLIEGIHFDMMYAPLKHLGYKAAVINFSDIYAMNGKPEQLIMGIAVSSRFTVEALQEIYEGIKLACKNYDVDFAGGDTTSTNRGLVLSGTVVGWAERNDVVYRSGAKENELIGVSGDLGAAYAGLLILEREKAEFQANPNMQPDLSGNDYVLERQLKPEARKDVIRLLKEAKIKPTSMIDISDGLASEMIHLCKNSGLGAQVYEEKLPIDPATVAIANKFEIDEKTFALNGGEDYELLFTITQQDYEKIKDIQGLTIIGHMTEENAGINMVANSGQLIPLEAQGWDSFRKEKAEKNSRNENQEGKSEE
ncbi:MAG: thiamine-phosphate kinase [Bacteroidales bacterium]|nr:thiamine-phosphate kinase [Bacteroidales bacterium]